MVGKVAVAVALAVGCGAAFGGIVTESDTSWWSLKDGVLTLTNTDDDLSSSTNVYGAVIGADVTKIVKTGAGAVRLDGANSAFAGEIEVQAGLLMGWLKEQYTLDKVTCYTDDNYGAPTKVTVSDGATFEMLATPIANVAFEYGRFANTQFYVSGNGVNGMGALYRKSVQQKAERSYATIKHLTLNGDTSLYVGMRWGFNNSDCTLVQNGYTLTYTGVSGKIFNFARGGSFTLTDPGDMVVDKVDLHYSENYNVTFAGTRKPEDQTITLTNGGRVVILAPGGKGPGQWTCPYGIVSYGGKLRGPSGSVGSTRWATFTGNLTLASGSTGIDNYNNDGDVGVYVTGTVNGGGGLKAGDGNGNVSTILAGGGSGGKNSFADLIIGSGRVVLTGGARYDVTNTTQVLGSVRGDKFLARLVITNSTVFMPPCNVDKSLGLVKIADSSGAFGLLEIGDGAVVTNDIRCGCNSGNGAVWLRGNAKLFWHGGGGSNPFLCDNGYGFLGIRDNAVLESQGWHNLGSSGGRCFVLQRGGIYRSAKCGGGHGSNMQCNSINGTAFKIGRSNGVGHYYNGGGTLKVGGSVWFTWDYPWQVHNSEGVFTVDGANATSEINDVCFCGTFAATPLWPGASKGTYGHVNVNRGGTLTVNRMYKTVQDGTWNKVARNWSNCKDFITNTWAFVNFDGGVMKIKGTGDFFSANGTAEDQRLPTRVTVYSGGAVIETAAQAKPVVWRLPIEKPYGKGVKSVTLPAEMETADEYIGPARVLFSGGNGSNVTAVVDFDETTRTNCGVIVTSSGFGFTEAPTVKFEQPSCNSTYYTAADVEMADYDSSSYVHGGLTKRGEGTLTLTRANTYGGATRCEGGTLEFTDAAGIPSGSVIEFPASALSDGDKDVSLLSAVSIAGHALCVTEADDLDEKTFGRLRKIVTVSTALSSLPAVTYRNTDGTYAERPDWRLVLSADGKTVKFGANRGTALIFR